MRKVIELGNLRERIKMLNSLCTMSKFDLAGVIYANYFLSGCSKAVLPGRSA